MAGLPGLNFPAFDGATHELMDAGYSVHNPADDGPLPGGTWEATLRIDLRALLECDGVATLHGHENSRGAWLETTVAHHLGMPIHPVHEWLDRA